MHNFKADTTSCEGKGCGRDTSTLQTGRPVAARHQTTTHKHALKIICLINTFFVNVSPSLCPLGQGDSIETKHLVYQINERQR